MKTTLFCLLSAALTSLWWSLGVWGDDGERNKITGAVIGSIVLVVMLVLNDLYYNEKF